MGVGISGSRLGALALALLALAAICVAALATDAGAVKLVGKDGRVYACYRAKGRPRGAVHLVTKKGRCHKGEKKISWNVTGPAGKSGENGESGSNGQLGESGAAGGPQTLEKQVTQLTNKVTALESILKGVTNTELLGALSKLQGVSGTGLQEAVASVTDVKALCAQTGKLTEQSNELGTALKGITAVGALALDLIVPQAPVPLGAFSC